VEQSVQTRKEPFCYQTEEPEKGAEGDGRHKKKVQGGRGKTGQVKAPKTNLLWDVGKKDHRKKEKSRKRAAPQSSFRKRRGPNGRRQVTSN